MQGIAPPPILGKSASSSDMQDMAAVDNVAEKYPVYAKLKSDAARKVGRAPAPSMDHFVTGRESDLDVEEAPSTPAETDFDENSVAPIQLPTEGNGKKMWHPTLLHRAGNKEAVCMVWLGDVAHRDRTIYVCFSPLRFKTQFFRICCAPLSQEGMSSKRVVQQAMDWSPTEGAEGGSASGSDYVKVGGYVKRKLDKMWDPEKDDKLYQKLLQAVKDFPTYRVVFAGISHGATLAQAAGLKFQVQRKETQVFIVTWNAYRWTDTNGQKMMEETLGTRILPFVLSKRKSAKDEKNRRRYWDSVTGFPKEFAPMPNLVLLDVDSGKTFDHPEEMNAEGEGSSFGARGLMRMLELHFAKSAITATKKSMLEALGQVHVSDDEEDFPRFGLMHEPVLATVNRWKRSSMTIAPGTIPAAQAKESAFKHARTFQFGKKAHRNSMEERSKSAAAEVDHFPTRTSKGKKCAHCFSWLSCCR